MKSNFILAYFFLLLEYRYFFSKILLIILYLCI